MTEIIEPADSRSRSPEMIAAIKKEVKGLLARGTFKVILKEKIPKDANVFGTRFVLAIKSKVGNQV